ncbi:hypothetical protein VTK56DRAFT_4101 [Thermocarpiscus australiensis]
MEKNTFDAKAVIFALSFMADSWIGREANLIFKAVDVLGVVPNQLARIAQITDEMVCSCRIGPFSGSTHAGDALVKERPPLRIEED